MSAIHLLLNEIRYRFFNFVLSLLAITLAAGLLAGGPTLLRGFAKDTEHRLNTQEEASQAELQEYSEQTETLLADMEKKTSRLMRDIGFNLYIVHKDTNFTDLHTNFHAVDMPEEYVHRLARSEELTKIVHLVATLLEKIMWQDRTTLLVGILPEVTQDHLAKKPPMGYDIEPGTVLVGHGLRSGKEVGDTLDIEGESFEIAQILPEQGTWEDAMLALHLHDAQRVLNKPDTINRITALGCRCKGDRLAQIRSELELALPETKVSEYTAGAIARDEQRKLVSAKRAEMMQQMEHAHAETLADLQQSRSEIEARLENVIGKITPTAILICALLVGLLAWMNVNERRGEIGLLRAIGRTSANIGALILGKALLLGLVGGAAGLFLGFFLATSIAQTMDLASGPLLLEGRIIGVLLIGSPLVAALASWLPTLHAIQQDPAQVLAEG